MEINEEFVRDFFNMKTKKHQQKKFLLSKPTDYIQEYGVGKNNMDLVAPNVVREIDVMKIVILKLLRIMVGERIVLIVKGWDG